MIFVKEPLPAGLYLVSTPIGNARDITLRALDTLASADIIAAEDTRSARKIMEIHGVERAGRPLWAYHDHSKGNERSRIVSAVLSGQSVAYVSEAGTPLVADPGYKLAREVIDQGGNVISVPGPSAVLAALTVGGLGTDRFFFAGFLPAAKAQRRASLTDLRTIEGTLVFYEAGRRIRELLDDMCDILGRNRTAALCRELTKTYETVERGSLGTLLDESDGREIRGEFVVLVGRPDGSEHDTVAVDVALKEALLTMRVKDAATAVSGAMGLNRRDVYQRALSLGRNEDQT